MQRRLDAAALAFLLGACSGPPEGASSPALPYRIDPAQVPGFGAADLGFLLHGSMSSEFIPERVLRAFFKAYPDLFPGGGLSAYGTAQQDGEDLPLGFTRRVIPHLGSQTSVGINCVVCHVVEIRQAPDLPARRVLGPAGHFSVYDFAGALAVSLARSVDPKQFPAFLAAYAGRAPTDAERAAAAEALASDPYAAKGVPESGVHGIDAADLEPGSARLVPSLLKLFRNVRVCLGLPDALPPPLPVLPGPGRSDAFSVLSIGLLKTPAPFDAPSKYGVMWNLADRVWVHWDGNNRDPLVRNLEASLGLGAPASANGNLTDLALVRRQTELTQRIRSPRYPWPVDAAAAARGERPYKTRCASCHDASEDRRLFDVAELGTDPNRARLVSARQIEAHNRFMLALEVPGYRAPPDGWRHTGRYWAGDLSGVWARSPYLHNGSVRTMRDLLTAPALRPVRFKRGSTVYDPAAMGFEDAGAFTFSSAQPGNSNAGHAYGVDLADAEKRDLIEHLKTR